MSTMSTLQAAVRESASDIAVQIDHDMSAADAVALFEKRFAPFTGQASAVHWPGFPFTGQASTVLQTLATLSDNDLCWLANAVFLAADRGSIDNNSKAIAAVGIVAEVAGGFGQA